MYALREEGDITATQTHHGARHTVHISIRALREEGDPPPPGTMTTAGNFYPRPPRGGRLTDKGVVTWAYRISIHALREEGDRHRTL